MPPFNAGVYGFGIGCAFMSAMYGNWLLVLFQLIVAQIQLVTIRDPEKP